MNRSELVEVFARFLNETNQYDDFAKWLDENGYSISEFEFEDITE